MSDNDFDFSSASRRALFGKKNVAASTAPGAGRSAAENAPKHSRVKVTINFDGDIIKHFKEKAKLEGRSYQVLINDALREFIKGTSAEQLARAVGGMLISDSSFLELLAEQIAVHQTKKDS